MNRTLLKSCASLLLGMLYFFFTANGLDFLSKTVYWLCVALILIIYFELMSMLWANTSSIFKFRYGWYYPVLLSIFYLIPPVIVIVKQCLELS